MRDGAGVVNPGMYAAALSRMTPARLTRLADHPPAPADATPEGRVGGSSVPSVLGTGPTGRTTILDQEKEP